jgi:hypothetical protein|tara:strand:- start:144 stop:428 length:285 start_codon:yes stop_codon:yes gene_type:complete
MLIGEFTYPGYRGVETNDTDQRVTEAGVPRSIEVPNAASGTISVTETYIAFAGAISAKNSGSFQTPVTYVKHNGGWVTAATAYYYETNIWKRIL